jgi:regulatory protein
VNFAARAALVNVSVTQVYRFLASAADRTYASAAMSRGPRKHDSDEDLYVAAMRALMRRAYSVFEMRKYLEQRAFDPEAAPRVLALLRERRYLDDAVYARQFAAHRTRVRRQGSYRIARELRARGVPDVHIEAALAEIGVSTDEGAVVRQTIARKLKALRGPLDQRRLASLQRSLIRAGFSGDTIRSELRVVMRDAKAAAIAEDAAALLEEGEPL